MKKEYNPLTDLYAVLMKPYRSKVKKLRVLVCGSRDWDNLQRIKNHLKFIDHDIGIECIIEGGQRSVEGFKWYGADYQAKVAAQILGIPVMEFQANWGFYKKSAGPIRNGWMLTFGDPDLVLAFHSDIKNSKGTKDMINKAKKMHIPVKVIK